MARPARANLPPVSPFKQNSRNGLAYSIPPWHNLRKEVKLVGLGDVAGPTAPILSPAFKGETRYASREGEPA